MIVMLYNSQLHRLKNKIPAPIVEKKLGLVPGNKEAKKMCLQLADGLS